jgi:hypothetical protein
VALVATHFKASLHFKNFNAMNPSADLTWLFGILISVLLSLVVYFVRLLHVDFRRMQKDRVGQLEARVKQFETIFYNTIHYEKE